MFYSLHYLSTIWALSDNNYLIESYINYEISCLSVGGLNPSEHDQTGEKINNLCTQHKNIKLSLSLVFRTDK